MAEGWTARDLIVGWGWSSSNRTSTVYTSFIFVSSESEPNVSYLNVFVEDSTEILEMTWERQDGSTDSAKRK